jgi:poly(glycerol-phosphate) alpha-glucosyltransferase
MNIAILSLISRRAGGLFYSVRGLSKALADQGSVPRIFSARDRFSEEDLPEWNPLEVNLYSSFGPLQSSFGLRPALAAADVELTHVHGIWLDRQWASLQWQKRTGKPVVISPRGMLDPWAVNNSAWKKKVAGVLFANESLRKAACIHALCQSEAESIRAYGLKTPIAIIPNGVEVPVLGRQREGDGGRKGKKQLLFLGRIHPKKGLSELLAGWAKAQSLNPKAFSEWQLLIAGWDDGNHLVRLKQQASQLGLLWSDADSIEARSSDLCPLSSDLCFMDPQYGDEKKSMLQNADAFVLPSFSEGLPMSVLEAWSYQLPVVMTDFCNIPEGFSSEAALHVEPNEVSIAQGLGQLACMSAGDLKTMGSNGRKLVERKFTWPQIATDMKAVYEWCLGGGNVPQCLTKG